MGWEAQLQGWWHSGELPPLPHPAGREGLVSSAGSLLHSRPPHTAHKPALTLQLTPSSSFLLPSCCPGLVGWGGGAWEVCVSEELRGGSMDLNPGLRAAFLRSELCLSGLLQGEVRK